MVALKFIFNKLDKDAIARIDSDVDVVLILKDLATLLFSKDEVDSAVHHKLFFQDIFDLFNFLNLIEVDRHLKLLVISTFDETFRPDKGEYYHSHILFL